MNQTILIVEDETAIARLLQLELEQVGFHTILAFDGEAGLEKALDTSVDLVLLDIMLPGIDGREVLRRLRTKRDVPVIFLTAKGALEDKVMGLEEGADDYIVKPFEMAEVSARVRSLLRRTKSESDATLSVGLLKADRETFRVTFGDTPLELTKKEFELLIYLMENAGKVCSRADILRDVWGFDYMGDTNLIDVYMRYLRAKIDDVYEVHYIKTVRGFGYKLDDK